jgi:hypothetical protein
MESHDYPIEHFRMMAEVAARLKSALALILEHSYSYESFGSWWFTFKRSGKKFRVAFDGRDKYLSLERGVVADGSKIIGEWQSVNGKKLQGVEFDSLISEVWSLVSIS